VLGSLFRTKSLDEILAAAEQPHAAMKRTLGPVSITMLGIGAIIGTGIYATIGTATAGDAMRPGAGPSLMISFVLTAVVCAFTALCYAEMAAMVPISGSAYTYAYATMGELIAWIIGWDLIIEYGVGNVSVAITWAGYFRSLVHDLGFDIPAWLATDGRTAAALQFADPARYAMEFAHVPKLFGHPVIGNLPACFISLAITALLVWGIRESATFNAVMVAIKIVVLVFFVGVGFHYVSVHQMTSNWRPFQPQGWHGTLAGAAIVFFAYIGFDAVSTVAEETKNPGRDLPVGILASLAICTLFYAVIAAVFTGMIPYREVVARPSERNESLTMALHYIAPNARYASMILGFGSVVAQTAVLLVFMLGQPRIFFSMARDGLLPPVFAKLHPKFRTPHVTTILTGVVVAVLSSVASIDEVVDLTNIGTLFAFVLVCVGIPILRRREPGRKRPFVVPFGPYLMPALGAVSCAFLMFYLPPASWWRFVGWLVLGMAVYASFGYTHSVVGREAGRPCRTPRALKVAAVGFLLVAVGLFTIPHQANVIELVRKATSADAHQHDRSLAGMGLIAVGLALGVGGWTRVPRERS
jgi:APA family basic amino acid/polyamine antiporter